MAEIKTCEQYVLSELFNEQGKTKMLEAQVDGLKANLKETTDKYCELVAKLSQLLKMEVSSSGGSRYISVIGIWESYEPEDFEYFSKFVTPENDHTKKEEPEDEEEKTE